jgi:hypothetical protein
MQQTKFTLLTNKHTNDDDGDGEDDDDEDKN